MDNAKKMNDPTEGAFFCQRRIRVPWGKTAAEEKEANKTRTWQLKQIKLNCEVSKLLFKDY